MSKPSIGERVLTRTYGSGVSIGILESLEYESGLVIFSLREAVRIWQWSGAFTVSGLATKGGECQVAMHPETFLVAEQSAEIMVVSDEAWADIQARWHVGAR